MGMSLYWVTVAGTFLVIAQMWTKRAWKEFPAFWAYLVMNGVGALSLWPLLYRGNQAAYNERAWYLQIVAIPFLAAAVGELFKAKWLGAFIGMIGAGILAGILGQIRLLVGLGLRPAAVELAREFRFAVVGIGLTLALAILFSIAYRKRDTFTAGFLISTALGAASLLIRSTGPERYLGTAAWMVALILWLGWFGQYRPERKSAYNHSPMRSRTNGLKLRRAYH